MKQLVIAVVALTMSTTVGFSQNASSNIDEPFNPNVVQLSKYLELSANQFDDVVLINEYFVDKQRDSLTGKEKHRDKKMYIAVYGNLKLMKDVLDEDQYRKYVTVLNVTNNNKKSAGVTSMIDSYLAQND